MRNEQEMLGLIMDVAKSDERIRGAYMNGSRANPEATKDIFQDYDIVYLVTETASFIRDADWVGVFGELLILQLPDELDKIAGQQTQFGRCYGYLMQFTDGNRIDLHIKTLDAVLEEYAAEKLTVTLLDKDGVLPPLPPPTDEDYWVKRPTQALYDRCCNEYRWVPLYIANGLWRGEIPYAMDSLNFWVRPQLVQMLSWYAGIITDFSCSAGKSGKYLYKYLPEPLWSRFLKTYPAADISSVWDAALAMSGLFEETAQSVAGKLGLQYNENEARRYLTYLRHVRALPKNAKEIF